jgi:hypothetical protein
MKRMHFTMIFSGNCSRILIVCFWCFLFLLACPTKATDTLYVDRNFHLLGINRDRKGSEANPYHTIAEAVHAARAGDVIKVKSQFRNIRCEAEEYVRIQESEYYPENLFIDKAVTIIAAHEPITLGECLQNPIPSPLILPEDADTIVRTKAALLNNLNDPEMQIIYIADDIEIDLAGELNIGIAAGKTLASGRGLGTQKGALLFTNEKIDGSLFKILGSNVRISGLRFRGHSISTTSNPTSRCIGIFGSFKHLEIDHNEFFGWPLSSIRVDEDPGDPCTLGLVHIHDNYIHHNLGDGLGYGIVIYHSYALIEKNVFDQNRHAIAGHGACYSGYEARWNVVLNKNAQTSHSFDMHRHGPSDKWGPAGEYVMIRENSFLYPKRSAFVIRGRPTEGAFVMNNTFINARRATLFWREAVRQKNQFGNLVVQNNQYETNYQNDLAFGDFDGDGASDVFWADGRNWWFSRQGSLVWTHLRANGNPLKDLAFGDFDGNDTTDVFKSAGGKWWVSWNGTGPWKELNTSNINRKDLAIGDFDGNGRTDVIRARAASKEWLVSFDGIGPWTKINTSAIGLNNLAFGNFDGNGRTDIFRTRAASKEWLVSFDGTGPWTKINNSNIKLSDIALGNFIGDDKTDVFRSNFWNKWYVSESGTGRWRVLNDHIRAPLSKLFFSDLNGDGRTDILMIKEKPISIFTPTVKRKTTEWIVSWGGTSAWETLNPDFDGDFN